MNSVSRRARLVVLGLLAIAGAARSEAPASASSALLWPLALQPALSSTFGETRATAFHAGIDLKTWGKTGYEVRAVADGWIQRVRTSPWGYGRALYQQLDDGRIAVYAHLEGFFAPLQERVQAAQRQARQYSVQLWLAEGDIPVTRGQVIARSGQSGAGPPHLHVEIRDASNVPHNPLLQGLGPVADTTPPTLRRLLVVPLSASSRVDGGYEPVAVALAPVPSNSGATGFEASRIVRVWGRIGIAVDSYDRADLATNKLAVLSHDLRVDGRPVVTSTFGRVSWADGHLVALDRLRPQAIEGVFTALFRRPGNRLPFYDIPAGDGSLSAGGADGLLSGTHEIVVAAHDVAGNLAQARLQLEVSAPPQIVAARLVPGSQAPGLQEKWFLEADFLDEDDERLTARIADAATGHVVRQMEVAVGAGPFTWELPADGAVAAWSVMVRDAAGNERTLTLALPRPVTDAEPFDVEISAISRARHVLLQVTSPRPLQQPPTVVAATQVLALQEDTQGVYRGILSLQGIEADELDIHCTALAADGGTGSARLRLSGRAAHPGIPEVIHLLDGEVVLHTAAGSAFEVFYPQAERSAHEADDAGSRGLVAVGVGCVIGPADAAFDERARISMKVTGPLDRTGVYADDGKGRWVFIGADPDGDDRISAPIRALGRFAVLQDVMPPVIAKLSPETGSVVDANVEFAANVTDTGSGINKEEDIILALDGVMLVAEYDPEAERVRAVADQPLEAGAHHLVATLRDAVGNETVARTDFISR